VILNAPRHCPIPHDIGPLLPSLPYLPRPVVPILRGPSASIVRLLKIIPHMIRTLGRQLTELSFRSQLLPSRLHTPGRRFFRIMNFQSAQTRRLCRPLFRHVCRQCVLDLIHLTNVRVSRPYYSLSQACLPHHYGLSSERLCFWQDWFSVEAMRCSFPGSPHLSSMSPEITCLHKPPP
jgi:hypothetical protein